MEHSSRMEQTTRKETSQTRARPRSLEQGPQSEATDPGARTALAAILAGAGLDQLNAGAAQALAARAGNSALLGLLARRPAGLQLVPGPPAGQPATPPLACRPEPPQLDAAPDLAGMAFPAGNPLEI